MKVMGTNTWEGDMPRDLLVQGALDFADDVKAKGIAELMDACIAGDENLMWCSWDTEDLAGLQAAFDEMNTMSGLVSKLTTVDIMFPAAV
ncbi:MAG: hypothetical protein GY720_05640 [bacterium]|nr:hypothetical protein [bacterium]